MNDLILFLGIRTSLPFLEVKIFLVKQKNILSTGKYIGYFKDMNNFFEIASEFQANHFRLTTTRGEGLWGWMKKVKELKKRKRGERQTTLILKYK